jgi:hypothetical protein
LYFKSKIYNKQIYREPKKSKAHFRIKDNQCVSAKTKVNFKNVAVVVETLLVNFI